MIWVAPSGGRDRADESGKYSVAPFDAKSVEMFRVMSGKSTKPTHFYPLSMFTYPICPPPVAVGGEVGETRTVKFAPAALHFGEEVRRVSPCTPPLHPSHPSYQNPLPNPPPRP